MIPARLLPILLLSVLATSSPAMAKPGQADRYDAALAYAQCVRDKGYAQFPDPEADGGFKFLVQPGDAPRLKAATAACRDLAPEGMRDEGITPEQLDVLIKLSQCIRQNGVPDFPDPGTQGNYDLSGIGIGPGDPRFDAALATCQAGNGSDQNVRITVGG